MLVLVGLAAGALAAVVLQPTVTPDQARYVALAVVAAIDAGIGGVRSSLERTFNERVLVIAFVTNAALAVLLAWLGDRLGVDITTAVVVVLGIRIFQNVAAIRRRLLGG